jgi:hypothetical protein
MNNMLTKSFADSVEITTLALSDYNVSLEEEAAPSNLTEGFIESKLCELEQIGSDLSENSEIYWLTYARLFELALLCAGNYADHFEFAAAGDLLVNPRLILIHFRSGCNAVKKDRHRNLTDQFQYVDGKRKAVVQWLKEKTVPEIVEKPLLVHMREQMARSGYLSKEYLDLIERRMEHIAAAIGFLASWQMADTSGFYLRSQCASPSEQSFIESNLCRFDKSIFFELGQDLRKLPEDPHLKSRFLGHRPADGPLIDAWFELNYQLQEEALDAHVNKTFIEQWFMRVWTIVSPRPECFWLFLARINELALLCASRYVDCCEFSAADELLVEPSCVLWNIEGGGPDASQDRAGCAGPMLPGLYDLLKGSGYMTKDYLLSVSRRIEQIGQVLRMLLGLGVGNAEDISMRLSCMDIDQRRDFRSRLCLFDQKIFNEIGRALHLFMRYWNVDDEYVGKYLRG